MSGVSLEDDISALEGEELVRHQEFVVNGVRAHLGEGEGMDRFLAGSKAYGRGLSSADDFISMLIELFGREKALVLVPTLAKLIRNDERRKRLVETAVNWPPPTPAKVLTIFDDDDDDGEDQPLAPAAQPAPTDDSPVKESPAEEAPFHTQEEEPSAPEEEEEEQEAAHALDAEEIGPGEEAAAVDEGVVAAEEPTPQNDSVASVEPTQPDEERSPLPLDAEGAPPLREEEVLEVVENAEREMVSVADFLGSEPWQLAVCEGDRLRITKEHEDGWTDVVSSEGGRGAVPTTFLEASPETVERDREIRQVTMEIRALVEKIPASYKKVAALTRSYSSGVLESSKFRSELVALVGDAAAIEIGKRMVPLVTKDENIRRFLENDLNEDEDWIERLRISRMPPEKAEESNRNPFAAAYDEPPVTSNPFEQRATASRRAGYEPSVVNTPTRNNAPTVKESPTHYDEREILLSRSHGVGAYNPETIERLQRLREDEELAQRLQREEELAAARPRIPQQSQYDSPHPERRQDSNDDFWGSLFGGGGNEGSSAPSSRRNYEHYEHQQQQQQSSSSSAVSGADVWSSIFGASTPEAGRTRQELDDERLARQLQADEARAAGRQVRQNSFRQQLPPVEDPLSPVTMPSPPPQTDRRPISHPSDQPEVGLFRCGACSETMHVRNAVPGAQFSCPSCGRVNTI